MPRDHRFRGYPWPSPAHERLLRAALCSAPTARAALAQWEAEADPQAIDRDAIPMMPLLARSIEAHGLPTRCASQYAEAYRRAWYRNQQLYRTVRGPLMEMHAAGVRTLLLKGAALLHATFEDAGIRSMADCDVLVPVEQVTLAVRVLDAAGFRPELPVDPALVQRRHSVGFRGPGAGEFDLHWHVLPDDRGPGGDEAFWEASVPLQWGTVTTRTLCPADHLLLVVCHAMRRGPKRVALSWLADARALVCRFDDADWQRLLGQTAVRGLSLPVGRTVEYLAARLEAPVPADVRSAFASRQPDPGERLEHWLQRRRIAESPLGVLPGAWFAYSRLCRRTGERRRPGGFLRFVRDRHAMTAGALAARAAGLPFRQIGWLVRTMSIRAVSVSRREGV